MNRNSSVTYQGKNFNTASNRVLVKVEKAERVTASGLVIPDTVDTRKDFKGTVVAVSPMMAEGKTATHISVGDRVIMRRNSGIPVPTDDKDNEYRIYKIGEILNAGF